MIESSFKTKHICPSCRKTLSYDGIDNELVCDDEKCGFRCTMKEFFDKYKKHTRTQKEGKKMSGTKGICVVCGRKTTIIGRGVCSACYPIGKKFNWDVDKVKEYRKEHPVNAKGKRGRPRKVIPHTQSKIPPTLSPQEAITGVSPSIMGSETSDMNGIKVQFEFKINIRNIKIIE